MEAADFATARFGHDFLPILINRRWILPASSKLTAKTHEDWWDFAENPKICYESESEKWEKNQRVFFVYFCWVCEKWLVLNSVID